MTNKIPTANSFVSILYDLVNDLDDKSLASVVFTNTKVELESAYSDGWKSCKTNIPATANPYEHPETANSTYSLNTAWSEGWMAAYLDTEMYTED